MMDPATFSDPSPNQGSSQAMVQVVTTTETHEDAVRIANHLVQGRTAVCVQIDGPLTSIYRWQGEIETATEYRCTIKARADRWPAIERAIREVHPYEVPEIIATRVDAVHPPYWDWLDGESDTP